MDNTQVFHFLKVPWAKCQDVVSSIAEQRLDKLEKAMKKDEIDEAMNFLNEIGFLNGKELSQIGENYYQMEFILMDKSGAQRVLTESLQQYQPTQIICQLLWGRNNLGRNNVYKLLLFKRCIDGSFKLSDLGSFLMLLNQCGILKYSKKMDKITVLYNPTTAGPEKPSTRFLSPETPYTNIKNLWETLRACKEHIYWIDKHFSAKGLEPLSEEADGTKIKEIRILTGLTKNINEKLKRDFLRFRKEMKNRTIETELRVICDKNVLQDIHDRWIISAKVCFNIPPINSIYKGQYAEVKETVNRPPFEEWWIKGLDLLRDWEKIIKNLN